MKITLFVSNKSVLVSEQMSQFAKVAEVEIVNVDDDPDRAQQEGIIVTPSVIIDAAGQRQRFNYFDRSALRDYLKYCAPRAA
jgi:hypothetical protein